MHGIVYLTSKKDSQILHLIALVKENITGLSNMDWGNPRNGKIYTMSFLAADNN